jgi:PAS domain S-box-containing protein
MANAKTGPGHLAGANLLLTDPERLVRAVEAAGTGLWEWDLRRNVVHLSSRLAVLLGLAPGTPQIGAADFFECMHPDDIALFRVSLSEALRDEHPFTHDIRVDDGDGDVRWLSFCGQILDRAEDGAPSILAGLCFDVTNQRRTQEAYDLLNRELSHRMKNLFSVVSSLVNMTSEHRSEAREFVASFQARLNTFAAAHDALMKAEWHAIPLENLVEKALSPLGVWGRIDLRNTRIVLGAQDAQTVVLVLHELATNAIKHGALSQGAGRIALTFETRPPSDEAGAMLVMVWTENGGPPVSAPSTRGFGIRLIERLTKRQTSGETVLDWRAEGLRCCVELPITPPQR